MRVAVLHYHLRPGGVTRVIDNAARALEGSDVRIAALVGDPPPEPAPAYPVRVIPGLGYDGNDDLLPALDAAAREALGGPPDLWHVHNHSLGKNLSLPRAARALAERGDRLVLQPHDFAEDFRAANYRTLLDGGGFASPLDLHRWLYPNAGHVHYAVLTTRDRDALTAGGLEDARVHLLPNAIALDGLAPETAAHTPTGIRVYPTRAIRRKNLGEFLLWALREPDHEYWVTLAPTSEADIEPYNAWRDWATGRRLPVVFEAGVGKPFAGILHQADAVVTTSIAEGFGLAFAEPWLAGKPLCGRALPDITRDLEDAGLDLSCLYERLDLPAELLPETLLRETIETAIRHLYEAYRLIPPRDALSRAWNGMVTEHGIDFGRLGETLQLQTLDLLAGDRDACAAIRPPALAPWPPDDPRSRRNRELLVSRYGLSAYRKRLLDLYRTAAGSGRTPVAPPGCGTTLLDTFLDPARLHLGRV